MKESTLWVSPNERYRLVLRTTDFIRDDGMLLSFRLPYQRSHGDVRMLVDRLYYFQWFSKTLFINIGWIDLAVTNSLDNDWIVSIIDSKLIPRKDISTRHGLQLFSNMQMMQANEAAVNEQAARDEADKKRNSR